MPKQVIENAQLACTFGAAPSALVVLPINRVSCGGQAAATVMDFIPLANIMPFGMCQSLANPEVAAATAAAMGALTPMPCVPSTSKPWGPGSTVVSIAGKPALADSSKCMCQWGGEISVVEPGQVQTES